MLPVRKRAGLWGPPWVSIAPKRDVEMASPRGGRSPAVYPGVDAAASQPFQGRVTFEEVAVYFTEEEWGRLEPGQRSLYSEVMFENYKTVTWLESHMNAKPHLISWLEDRENECSLQSAAEEERLSGGLRKYLLPDQLTNWTTDRRDIQWTDLWDGQTTDGMTNQHLSLQDSLRYAATLASLSKKRKVDREGRRFQDKWKLDYFFTEVQNNCVCLICQKTVAVFKEFNIKRHYQTKHADYAKLTGKERSDKLMELEASLVLRQCFFARARESSEDATKASYRVAALMAKHCRHFTEGEFIKDCAMQMVEQICPERKQDFANVCLARSTLARRIEDISSDLKRQLAAKGAEFDFYSLACDVSTEASDSSSQLLIFLRGVDKDMNVSEELLDLQSFKDQKRGTDLFACVCSAVDGMRLTWNKVTGIVTDGAPAMAGEPSGLASLVCKKVSEEGGTALKLHCILHQQGLWAKHLRYDHVTKPVMKTINYIRARALNHPQFQQFLQDIQAEEEEVYRSDIRGLSWGAALPRFYSLREEIGQFLTTKGQPMPELSDPAWLADLAFFVDIAQHLHGLNAGLQRQSALVTQLYSHLKVFTTKLQLFQRHLSQTPPNTSHFPSLQRILSAFPENDLSVQIRRYESDVSSLAEEFQQRFQDFAAMEKDVALFSDPFSAAPDDAPNHLQLEIIELQCDLECRTRHQQLPLAGFYRQLDRDRFREVRAFAKKMLSLFGSTYLCEKTASIMNVNKSRMRKRLSDSHLRDILRIKTTGFEPDLAYIIQSRSQCHPSH